MIKHHGCEVSFIQICKQLGTEEMEKYELVCACTVKYEPKLEFHAHS